MVSPHSPIDYVYFNDNVSLLSQSHVLLHSYVLVPERLIVVSEWYEDSVERHIQSKTFNK